VNQNELVDNLVSALISNPNVLLYAQNIATAIVNGPTNHCAATLSALLVFAGIYPNGGGTGNGDLEPWVPSLAYDLENRRGWERIDVGATIQSGDVGVVLVSAGVHHIYLIVDASDQAQPLIADNRSSTLHPRAVGGDQNQGWSPTTYLLRAPQSS
jgi:hypothetical protein